VLLHEAFEQTAQRLAAKTALVDGDHRVSYGELLRRSWALAQALRADGLAIGDRVLILLESGAEYAVAVHAVLMAGAAIVPISPFAKSHKVAFIATDTRAAALLTEESLRPAWESVISQAPHLISLRIAGSKHRVSDGGLVREWPVDGASVKEIDSATIDQDLAALIYTSGTTGISKGVMLTHLNMVSAWNSVQSYLGLRETDVIGLALPPAFSYGLYYLLMGLGLGATVIMERTSAFPQRLLEILQRERVTVFPGVPTLFSSLLETSNLPSFDLSSMRILTNAAAAIPDRNLKRLRTAFPQANILPMYGLTECKRASYLPPDQIDLRPGSIGRGMPNQEHWLVDEEGHRLPLGSTGELVVRGSHVMRGYWERPSETDERLKPGRYPGELVLHTGDFFRSDLDGYLYFVARKDDIIKSRGEKVAPREVENVIHQLEDVTACAVVGVPDDSLGHAVKAYVVVRRGSGLTARDIIRHCLVNLESYMAPKFVELVDELPRTDSGKIRHASLR
jgi:amino acid adenylation domain-containing protein